ncbi:Hypothetical predicted protein [Cloeon dipterum]|uniref:Glutaredoxin domain-containing protein n=1 Tax=Cloeon dipterum TaxID=197152 RepID=A0A8S1E261_9INSE|nr:Hypothetical predicted protein [Cloeon dipterum]
MAGSGRLVKRLLLYLAISTVFRPCSVYQQSRTTYEYRWTKFRPPDGVDSTPAVQGVSVPVWMLLVHYGSIEVAESREVCRQRRRRESGVLLQRAARHLLFMPGMPTMRRPVYFLLGSVNSHHMTTAFCFIGTGAYFLIILISMMDIETNPGPADEPNSMEALSRLLDVKLKVTNDAIDGLKDVVEGFGTRLTNLSDKIEELTNEKVALVARVDRLEKQLATQEGERRRRNAVVFGVPTADNLELAVDDLIFGKLELPKKPREEVIESFFRIGKPDGQARPIVIKFCSQAQKSIAMKNAFKLKGKKVAITDDLTPEERNDRRELLNARKDALRAGMQVKVLRNGLIVGGEKMTLADIRAVGWLDNIQQSRQKHSNDSESVASASQNGMGQGAAAAKKRDRQTAMLSPDNPPLEPRAGLSQGFATAPLNKKKASSQTKAVGNSQRGRKARSLERVTRSTTMDRQASSEGSIAE